MSPYRLLAGGLTVVGLCACSGGSSPAAVVVSTSSSEATGVSTTPDTGVTPPPGTTTQGVDGLEGLLITSVPAGYVQQPDSVGDTGPSDLAKAARDDADPDAEAVLTKDGFVHGYQRLWQSDETHQIVVFLYQFADVSGAVAYHAHTLELLQADPTFKSQTFSVSGIPGAIGLQADDGTVSAAIVLFTSGVHVVQIDVVGPSPARLEELAQQMAEAQFARL